MTAKEEILELMMQLPDDLTVDEALERLQLLYDVQKGLDQLAKGECISHEEAKRRIRHGFSDIRSPRHKESARRKPPMTIKQEIIKLMQELPDEATAEETIDQAMDRLYLLYRIQRGDKQIEEGQRISHKEVGRRVTLWRG